MEPNKLITAAAAGYLDVSFVEAICSFTLLIAFTSVGRFFISVRLREGYGIFGSPPAFHCLSLCSLVVRHYFTAVRACSRQPSSNIDQFASFLLME